MRRLLFFLCLLAASVALAKVDCLCVYYPHWHRYPKGDEWFGADRWKEAEWCFVKDAIPRFPGHHQPIIPTYGYLNGADPADVAKEIDLAADAGIDVFLYDYYWYDGQKTQEESIEQGFLKAPNRARMKFALMWCYHERRYAWRLRPDEKPWNLMSLAHTEEEFLGLIDYAIVNYFPRPEYYRKDGKLFFSLYEAPYFYLKRGSDAEKVRAQLEKARAHVRAAGLGELHINAQGVEPNIAEQLAACGFDSFTHYNPDRSAVSSRNVACGRDPLLLDYVEVMAENRKRWERMSKMPRPYIPNLSTGWDSTPRCHLKEPYPWKKLSYPYLWTVTNNTPENFRRELAAAKRFAEQDPKQPGAVYINGWNEYTEGTYLVPDNFNGDGFLRAVRSVFAEPEGNSAVRFSDETPVVAEVREYGGVPTLWIDGRPDTGLMHWNRWMMPEDVAVFRDAGIHLFSFMGAPEMPNPEGGDVDYSDGLIAKVPILTPKFIDERMAMILRADPKAKVLLRLRLTTPDWWRKRHPGETVRVWDEETKGGWYDHKWGSPASASWRHLMADAVRRVIRHCETAWPGRIIGYHPGLGSCAENSYDWGQSVADFSEASRASFHGTMPNPEIFFSRSISDVRRLLDPVKDAGAIAFRQKQSAIMADAVLELACVVKNELARLGRRKVCGAFYGYFCFSPNRMQFFASGHGDFKRILESPDIDMICAPLDYSSRAPGNVALAQTLPASIALHGKLYYGEEDTRFHTAVKDKSQRVSGDPKTSCDLLWRNFASTWSQGGSVWWMDLFGEGWYRDADLAKAVGDCRAFAESHLARRQSVAQVAVFVSERAAAYERVAPLPLVNEVVSPTLNEVAAIGAPFDVYLLEDIPLLAAAGRLAQYRLAILPNAHVVDTALRQMIRRDLCAEGRTVVFQGLPGYVCDHEKGTNLVTQLTGLGVCELPNRNAALAETFLDGRRFVWGGVQRSDPQLVIADSGAEELGWFVQGTVLVKPGLSNGAALASRRFSNWRSVVCTIHSLPSEVLRVLAVEAGVRVYSEPGAPVFVGADWLALSAKMSGRHRVYPVGGRDPLDVDLKRGEFLLKERKR